MIHSVSLLSILLVFATIIALSQLGCTVTQRKTHKAARSIPCSHMKATGKGRKLLTAEQCATLCPMGNLSLEAGKAISGNRCTLCYRCSSRCPTQALTILGRRVYEQCLLEKYL